jgi:hypothetical protein
MLSNQDGLKIDTFETLETAHNACAPVTYYVFRCRTCQTCWHAIEVYDEDGHRPSEWSWSIDRRPRA